MVNKIVESTPLREIVRVGSVDGGTLVRWYSDAKAEPDLFVVSINKSHVAAVSLAHGTHLTVDAMVEIVPAGETFTITAGGKQ